MTHTPDVDVLMVGHFAKDRIVIDGRAQVASGGAVYYGGMALRRLGLKVAIATRLHPEDYPRLETLKRQGIQVFASPGPATSGIENTYDSRDMERRVCKLLGFAGPFRPEDIPALSFRVSLITPIIAGEVDLGLLELLAARGPVGLDVQGFVRVPQGEDLVFEPWSQAGEVLPHLTYLKVDQTEAELLTGETDLASAVRALAALGPTEVVATQSSGAVVMARGEIVQAPFESRSLEGRTGRGDTCFACYVGKRLSEDPEAALRLAAAITSLKQERPGPWTGEMAEVEALLAGWHRSGASP